MVIDRYAILAFCVKMYGPRNPTVCSLSAIQVLFCLTESGQHSDLRVLVNELNEFKTAVLITVKYNYAVQTCVDEFCFRL